MVGVYQSKAQTGFNFNCARDTVINSCTVSCITLKSRIPDIHASTASYVVNQMSGAAIPSACFAPYVSPSLPGTPGNINTDDVYSSVVPLPFPFPFFGTTYTSLVLSTNGYVSFDITRAGLFSHYSTAAGNLPSTTYDRALIMGPYHDLDPFYTTSPPPGNKIKYDILGVAPHRRWVFSFYKVPLFSTACQNLIQNTHQIVLYEGTGVVEVFIQDKQICPGWNSGKAMIGMQNYARNAAIMAPGRRVSDPPWGSIGMNESWRFTPAAGPTLYRKVELFDLTGNLVSTGDTTSIGNNVFEVAFPNVCTSATTTFIVKSTYESINTPGTFEFGTDTVRIVRPNSVALSTTIDSVKCNGVNNGSITIATSGGVGPFQYSIDGGATYQSSPTFPNLDGGVYNVHIVDQGTSCPRDTVITVFEPAALTATLPTLNATCSATPNGQITVNGSGGVGAYEYSIDGTTFQTSNTFAVTNGTYNVSIRDANLCVKTFPVTVNLTNDLVLNMVRKDTTICKGSSVQLTTSGNGATYSWSPSASLNNSTIASPIATPSENTLYTVNVVLGQCSTSSTVQISVKQDVHANAGQPISIIFGDQAQLFGTAVNATSYLWTPSAGLSNTTILAPIVKPQATTLYTLTVKNDIGCTDSSSVLVTVIPYCIKVKNAFTPNGDGINDLWTVFDQFDCLRNVTVHVFNRYGNEVFSSKDYRNNWDGRYKGKSVPDGTYYAVVDFTLINGKIYTAKTDLTIMR